MPGTLASLLIKLGLDATGVEQGVARAEKSIGGLSTGAGTGMKVAGSLIYGVQTCLLARKDDAGTRTIRSLVRQSTTDHDCGGDHALSTAFAYVLDIRQQDPTGSDWTISNVNADEYGVKLVA